MSYTLFYHQDCPDYARQAALTSKLDWLKRIKLSTEAPPSGELVKGEIVPIPNDGEMFSVAYATRKFCLNVLLYFPLGLLLFLKPIFNLASKVEAGYNGDSGDVALD